MDGGGGKIGARIQALVSVVREISNFLKVHKFLSVKWFRLFGQFCSIAKVYLV